MVVREVRCGSCKAPSRAALVGPIERGDVPKIQPAIYEQTHLLHVVNRSKMIITIQRFYCCLVTLLSRNKQGIFEIKAVGCVSEQGRMRACTEKRRKSEH